MIPKFNLEKLTKAILCNVKNLGEKENSQIWIQITIPKTIRKCFSMTYVSVCEYTVVILLGGRQTTQQSLRHNLTGLRYLLVCITCGEHSLGTVNFSNIFLDSLQHIYPSTPCTYCCQCLLLLALRS